MANIQIANLAQIENQFDELSDLELETVLGGKIKIGKWTIGGGLSRGGVYITASRRF